MHETPAPSAWSIFITFPLLWLIYAPLRPQGVQSKIKADQIEAKYFFRQEGEKRAVKLFKKEKLISIRRFGSIGYTTRKYTCQKMGAMVWFE